MSRIATVFAWLVVFAWADALTVIIILESVHRVTTIGWMCMPLLLGLVDVAIYGVYFVLTTPWPKP